MRYAFSLLAFVTAILGPPLTLGVVGGLLARRRPILGAVAAWLIGVCTIGYLYNVVVPLAPITEGWQLRVANLVATFCASTIGIGAVVRSRGRGRLDPLPNVRWSSMVIGDGGCAAASYWMPSQRDFGVRPQPGHANRTSSGHRRVEA